MKEYAIWGTKNGVEDIIKINGKETQTDLKKTQKIIKIIKERREFQKVRIQVIDLDNFDLKTAFIGTLK